MTQTQSHHGPKARRLAIAAATAIATFLAPAAQALVRPACHASCFDVSKYEGKRVRYPGRAEVYLILDGQRRHVPDEATYDRLFDSWRDIVDTCDTDHIPLGRPLSNDANLVRFVTPGLCLWGCTPSPKIYLSSNSIHRWIVSERAFAKYGFSWRKVGTAMGARREGPNIE
ncbi:MAG: hypothetical protein RIF41_24825 [Polyangiaceae bacterium]